jgi:hypothetical protein
MLNLHICYLISSLSYVELLWLSASNLSYSYDQDHVHTTTCKTSTLEISNHHFIHFSSIPQNKAPRMSHDYSPSKNIQQGLWAMQKKEEKENKET